MESEGEQNYWPGFVDALSNVVLTLVFVLVIFVFALVLASNKVEKKMQEITQPQNKASSSSSDAEKDKLKEELANAVAQLKQMRGQGAASDQQQNGALNQQAVSSQNQDRQISVTANEASESNQGPVNIQSVKNSVTLSFPLTVVQMDTKSEEQLGHVLDAVEKTVPKHKILMRSIVGRETYTAAQRMAYYRAISARNYLITKMGEQPDSISISIVTPPQPEDGRVEIVLQKN